MTKNNNSHVSTGSNRTPGSAEGERDSEPNEIADEEIVGRSDEEDDEFDDDEDSEEEEADDEA